MENTFFFLFSFSVTFCDIPLSHFDIYDCNVFKCHFSLDFNQIFPMLMAFTSQLHNQLDFVKHL